MAGRGHFAVHNPGRRRFRLEEMMTNAMVTFGIAVGGTSLICYAEVINAAGLPKEQPH